MDAETTVVENEINECKEATRVPISGTSYVSITGLKEHPLNTEIYGDTYDSELLNSIDDKGILVPLLITRDNVIISGHRRFRAAKTLSISEVPVTMFGSDDPLDIEEALLDSNKHRTKTHSQIVYTYKHYKKIEEERALRRKLSNLKQSTEVENFPQAGKGKSRDKAAEKVGKSGKTMEAACKVQDKIDELKEAGKRDEAVKIENIFNEKGSVNGALNAIKKLENGGFPGKKKVKEEPIVDTALLKAVIRHAENKGLSLEDFLWGILHKEGLFGVEIIEREKVCFVVSETLLENAREIARNKGLSMETFLKVSLESIFEHPETWRGEAHEAA